MAKRRGLTLIEILWVLGIMSLLCALVLPVLGRARRASLGTVEVSNLKQVYLGMSLYEEDHAQEMPTLLTQTMPYLREPAALASPLDREREPDGSGQWSATPLIVCSEKRWPTKVSFVYLRTWPPFDEDQVLWREARSNSQHGLLASPWMGMPLGSVSGAFECGDSLGYVSGPRREGAIQRIQMDGSLFKLTRRRNDSYLGAGLSDLFVNR